MFDDLPTLATLLSRRGFVVKEFWGENRWLRHERRVPLIGTGESGGEVATAFVLKNALEHGFYEAYPDRFIGERPFDEDGVMPLEVVYECTAIEPLTATGQPELEEWNTRFAAIFSEQAP